MSEREPLSGLPQSTVTEIVRERQHALARIVELERELADAQAAATAFAVPLDALARRFNPWTWDYEHPVNDARAALKAHPGWLSGPRTESENA